MVYFGYFALVCEELNCTDLTDDLVSHLIAAFADEDYFSIDWHAEIDQAKFNLRATAAD